jgi:AcrR family transcriptional regulator
MKSGWHICKRAVLAQSEGLKFKRPPKDLRDQARRDQIVTAARQCVVRHGFHAATMAEIAVAAQMSVGQIYRYFPNKEEIVHAIVERIVAQRLQGKMQLPAAEEDVPSLLAQQLAGDSPPELREDHILMLEVIAEATRNPAVAEIVRQADQRLHDQAVAIFLRDNPQFDREEASRRIVLLTILFEGAIFHKMRRGRLEASTLSVGLYRDLIARVLSAGSELG